ncbi:hypothetical protein V1514DRAFT_282065 [Lipomyces japonicus]|uniref:uncharacterized protein n=1 Tax=Lipomyces japonicus TaxID=56871 RepID=UPI0034CD4820
MIRHNSLQTFQAYAIARKLDPASTYYRGTIFEYTVQDALGRLGFVLDRCGGRSDRGMDLRGTFDHDHDRVRVVVSCKAWAKNPGPAHVRELCGVLHPDPDPTLNPTLGVLACTCAATAGTLQAVRQARQPIAIAVVRHGGVAQLAWNQAAARLLHNWHAVMVTSGGGADRVRLVRRPPGNA